ncbi:MAG: alkaline phosphatase family protein [Gallionella sp.]
MNTFNRSKYTLSVALLVLGMAAHAAPLPRPDHIVVVIEENRSYRQIMDEDNRDSYIHALAKRGVLFTNSFGITHPSQPNYLAIFSGSTQGVSNNACPLSFYSDNLASALLNAGLSFASYAESLPGVGDSSCTIGAYRRKHNPLASWQDTRVSEKLNRPFAEFPGNFGDLPTVAFVIPNQDHDMHDGSFAEADNWLKINIAPYVDWAMKNNSLLILTWDEDNYQTNNHVATILVGSMLTAGKSDQRINHYSVLRTLLDFYGLPGLGNSADAESVQGVWR